MRNPAFVTVALLFAALTACESPEIPGELHSPVGPGVSQDCSSGCLYIDPSRLTFATMHSPRQYFYLGPQFSPNGGIWCSPSYLCFGTCPSYDMTNYKIVRPHAPGTKWKLYAWPNGKRTGACTYIFQNGLGTKWATLHINVE